MSDTHERQPGLDDTQMDPAVPAEDEQQEAIDTTQADPEEVADKGKGKGKSKAKTKTKKPHEPLVRVPGRSIFPLTRILKILKADEELPQVSREVVFLIATITELFVQRFALHAEELAERDGRLTLKYQDCASTVRRHEEYFFMEEIVPLYQIEQPAKRQTKKDDNKAKGSKTLDAFEFTTTKGKGKGPARIEEDEEGDGDVVMNGDGTMTL